MIDIRKLGVKWKKVLLWLFLAPIVSFLTLMVLLYVPPVQNLVCQKAASIASESLGMDISIRRVDLRFPLNLLVHEVQAVQQGDTLLDVGSLNVRVKAWPLLQGKVDVMKAELSDAKLNTASMIEGVIVKGNVGNLSLQSHDIDLNTQEVLLNDVLLADAQVYVAVADTTAEDTPSEPVNWKIRVDEIKLSQVGVDFEMPLDTLALSTFINEAELNDGLVDLANQRYEIQNFVLDGRRLSLDMGEDKRANKSDGFDPSHLALYTLHLDVDSILYQAPDIKAVINELNFFERSGFEVSSLTGRFLANNQDMKVDDLRLLTPNSEASITASLPMVIGQSSDSTSTVGVQWSKTDQLTARVNARIGKEDLMMLAGKELLDDNFRQRYPNHPFILRTTLSGNLQRLEISQLNANLPGALSLASSGQLNHITDSLARNGQLKLGAQTGDLNFLLGLAGIQANDLSVTIPDSIRMTGNMHLDGAKLATNLTLIEGKGKASVIGSYHLLSEAYEADVRIDSLRIDHFLPQDSIYLFSGHALAKGKHPPNRQVSSRRWLTRCSTKR